MDNQMNIIFQWIYLQDKTWLTVRLRWVSERGCYRVTDTFIYNGCQSVHFKYYWANHIPIKLLTRPKIIDGPLTVILRIGLSPCRFPLGLDWLSILWLYITASKSLPNSHTYKSKNHCHSIDSHFQHWAVSVSLGLLQSKAANMGVMNNSMQLPFNLTQLQHQHSLTLHSHSPSTCFNCCFLDNSFVHIII